MHTRQRASGKAAAASPKPSGSMAQHEHARLKRRLDRGSFRCQGQGPQLLHPRELLGARVSRSCCGPPGFECPEPPRSIGQEASHEASTDPLQSKPHSRFQAQERLKQRPGAKQALQQSSVCAGRAMLVNMHEVVLTAGVQVNILHSPNIDINRDRLGFKLKVSHAVHGEEIRMSMNRGTWDA